MTAITDRYQRLSDQFTKAVEEIPADQWTATTPCDGWSVTDVLHHVVDTNRDFLGQHLDLEQPAGDPVADWQAVAALTQAAMADGRADQTFEGYFGPTTVAEAIDRFYGMDLLVHRWDIARGAGLVEHEQLDDADAAYYLEAARANGDALRMEGICGPEVPAPADASVGEQLLAFLGRTPR